LKLNYKKLGLFKIKKIVRFVNYELVFLKIINIYLIFYVFLFEKASLGVLSVSITEIELINFNIKYKIEEILNHKRIKGYIKYLIK
jgi:hypothetical protein